VVPAGETWMVENVVTRERRDMTGPSSIGTGWVRRRVVRGDAGSHGIKPLGAVIERTASKGGP